MYPVLGYYNQTAVIIFTENALTSHSHTMLPMIMAGIVALVAVVYGYQNWTKNQRIVATFGFVVMSIAMIATIWIYWVSGVGNYSIPTLLTSGPGGINGVAADDVITALVGLGALFVLIALLMHSAKEKTQEGKTLLKDPLFLSVITAWIMIYLVIPITGYYIEFHQDFYSAAGAGFAAFTRFHQDFGFFLLPALVTTVLIFETFGLKGATRKRIGLLYLAGEIITFVFGEVYTMVSSNPYLLGAAVFGGILMGMGVILGINFLRKPNVAHQSAVLEQRKSLTQ
ncbi:MAG: hypothetical protein JRN52_06880 [Nitrososphaerota archaeon]|nr:hypothetical protein [Nitrososphaerota archaeon]